MATKVGHHRARIPYCGDLRGFRQFGFLVVDEPEPVPNPAQKKRAKKAQRSANLGQIGSSLGLVFAPEDIFYVMTTGVEALQNRAALARRAALYSALLDRILPDTELSRHRFARLLMGLEAVSRALRVLLTLDDIDLLGEVKRALTATLDELARSGGQTDSVETKAEFDRIVARLKALSETLSDHPDPRVQNALVVFTKFDELLDPKAAFPKLPPYYDLTIREFKPTARRLKTQH